MKSFFDSSGDVDPAVIVVEQWPKLERRIEAFDGVEVQLDGQLVGSHNS